MLSSIFQMPLATQTYGSQMLQSGKGKDWFISRIFQLLSCDMGAIFELQQLKILEHGHNAAWTHSTYFCIKDLQIINRRFTMFVFSTRFLYFSRQKINSPCINKQYFVTSSAHVLPAWILAAKGLGFAQEQSILDTFMQGMIGHNLQSVPWTKCWIFGPCVACSSWRQIWTVSKNIGCNGIFKEKWMCF